MRKYIFICNDNFHLSHLKSLRLKKSAPKLDQKAHWVDQKASGLKWDQILTKKMSPQYRDRIEGRTRPSFTRTSEVYAISKDNQTLEKIS